MKKSVRQIINELDYEDILKLKYDIEHGSLHIKKLLDSRMKEIENKNIHICATCGKKINPFKDYEITLSYGYPDFRRRAHFCGIDCLEHFIEELKRIEKKKRLSKE